jgi:DNA-binding beta-propeller fold protein YncE
MFILPHGIHVDRVGNVWITDADGPDGRDPNKNGKGHAVYKFSPGGQVLLTLGTPGVAGDGTGPLLNQPTDVVTAPNGDIFVADGDGAVARIVKFTKTGTLIKFWGKGGSGQGELTSPHSLAIDSRGRLFVADRGLVSVIDVLIDKCLGSVDIGNGVDQITLNTHLHHLYTANGGSRNLSVIDTISLQPRGEVGTGPSGDGVAADPATDLVYVIVGRAGIIAVYHDP